MVVLYIHAVDHFCLSLRPWDRVSFEKKSKELRSARARDLRSPQGRCNRELKEAGAEADQHRRGQQRRHVVLQGGHCECDQNGPANLPVPVGIVMGALSGVAQEESGYWVPWCVARPSKIGHVHMLFMSVTTRVSSAF